MNFLDVIFENLRASAARPVLQEVREGNAIGVSGEELLAQVRRARAFLAAARLQKGDRCVLLAHNSIRWAAVDLALMAEGVVVVPLYARQAPEELAAIIHDCSPVLVLCGDAALRDSILPHWPEPRRAVLLEEVFSSRAEGTRLEDRARPLRADEPVALIYTSGTAGVSKGVVLTVGNVSHMVPCTNQRLDALMRLSPSPERVFHYLPFCFAGSWILLLTCLSRASVLTLSSDLTKLVDELKLAAPQYFLNVPALLERVRRGVEEQLAKKGGVGLRLFAKGRAAWLRQRAGQMSVVDKLWLALANALVFPAIRRGLGPNLQALVCGSAPLAVETQLFFMMLGLPVLQVYGLTETTAICTMDIPGRVEPGKVGYAIPGTEMKLGEHDEILVRGPHIFPGYWNRTEETAQVLRDGWFHTGDQGEVDAAGNWRLIGRVKDLIILNSGHNIPPEPLEEMLLQALPGAQQVVLVGDQQSHLAALVTGAVTPAQVQSVLESLNGGLPHYRRIHAFHICEQAFTIENGLLTANGKLKRDVIVARYQAQIKEMYSVRARSG